MPTHICTSRWRQRPGTDRSRTRFDEAIARYWKPRTLEQLMAGVPVLGSWDQLDIADLTDEEREAFAKALDEHV
jgi:hypothetical protein